MIINNYQNIMSQNIQMIKFKLTQSQQEVIQLAYEPNRKIQSYKQDISQLYDCQEIDIKLVFKGKILTDNQTAENAKLADATVMVVLNRVKKQQKKSLTSQEQVIPGAGMSTGLGSSSPVGFGAYEMVNHPQYMSAISNAVDPQKMEEMMNDPQYQGVIEQMLNDPDMIRHAINQNPMLRKMVSDNPYMKMMLQNPTFLKMMMNPEMIKKSKEIMKNGGYNLENMMNPSSFTTSLSNGQTNPPNFNSFLSNQNYGSLFGQSQTNPINQNIAFNPLLNNPMFNSSVLQSSDQIKYQTQLKQLSQFGFKDRAKNIIALKQFNGDIDKAIQKLYNDQ